MNTQSNGEQESDETLDPLIVLYLIQWAVIAARKLCEHPTSVGLLAVLKTRLAEIPEGWEKAFVPVEQKP